MKADGSKSGSLCITEEKIMWSDFDLSSQECRTKQFPSIDIMKLLYAVLVVTIHTSPLNSINKYFNYGLTQYIARLAVPFFFVTSGYFCFRKTTLENFEKGLPLAYAKRIFLLYIFGQVFICRKSAGVSTVMKKGLYTDFSAICAS